MKIIGKAWDKKSETQVIYAQISPREYLETVGDDFGQFEIQRKRESHKGYTRLKQDILQGALLPPITLALKPQYVDQATNLVDNEEELANFLSRPNLFNILDGLQRTYILNDIAKEKQDFKEGQELLLEIWLEGDIQKLIYRIIVLNAGQKPMSIRHQVELLFSSLQKPIEEKVGNIELVKEKDLRRRRKAGIFSFEVVVSGYQAFLSGSTELNKENLISQKLQIDSSFGQDESQIYRKFEDFVSYLSLYARLDQQVFRIYPGSDANSPPDDDSLSSAYQHWMTTENTCISYFASISQFAPYDDSQISSVKRARIFSALEALLKKLEAADIGTDPLQLNEFEAIRRGKNARKVNIGAYTRRLLSTGLKELYREEGQIELLAAWNLAAD